MLACSRGVDRRPLDTHYRRLRSGATRPRYRGAARRAYRRYSLEVAWRRDPIPVLPGSARTRRRLPSDSRPGRRARRARGPGRRAGNTRISWTTWRSRGKQERRGSRRGEFPSAQAPERTALAFLRSCKQMCSAASCLADSSGSSMRTVSAKHSAPHRREPHRKGRCVRRRGAAAPPRRIDSPSLSRHTARGRRWTR